MIPLLLSSNSNYYDIIVEQIDKLMTDYDLVVLNTMVRTVRLGNTLDRETGEGIYWTRVTKEEMNEYRKDKTIN